MPPYIIRDMTLDDVPRLVEINPTFTSETTLRVERTGGGFTVGWRLVEVELPMPFDKRSSYDFDEIERANITGRLLRENTLMEVAVDVATGRLVGVLDVAEEDWRNVSFIWNIMMDVGARGQGIGQRFIAHTIGWARQRRNRAVMLETQTNNVPACKFYARMGFQLVGINDAFYTNNDYGRDEIALFWSYPLM